MTPKWDDDMYVTLVHEGMYAEKNIDVAFFGTSQIVYGISPMELYEEYGIKGYDCASGAQSMVVTYYWVKEVIEKKHPSVVVLDVYSVMYDELAAEETIRQSFDYMHFGKNKMDAARDVMKYYDMESDYISFAIPAVRYHSRWKDLEKKDFTFQFQNKSYYRKGAKGGENVCPFQMAEVDFSEITDTAEESFLTDYLRKILDYCKETDTPIVLTKTPIAAYPYAYHNTIQNIADEYGVPFVDMMDSKVLAETGIDSMTDFDGLPHLNMKGSVKATRYLGKYLVENYPAVLDNVDANLKDRRWQKELVEYQEYRAECLEKIENP